MEALITGYCFSASTAALRMKGRKVRLAPVSLLKEAFRASRARATSVRSTSWKVVTWAEVRRLAIMCSAIFARMIVMGSTRTPAASHSPAGAPSAAGASSAAAGAPSPWREM